MRGSTMVDGSTFVVPFATDAESVNLSGGASRRTPGWHLLRRWQQQVSRHRADGIV
jgi:hypothetical protein